MVPLPSLDGSSHHVARIGIPQGSVLSARLCSIHFAAADHAALARFLPRAANATTASAAAAVIHLQLRVVDDTLQVSWHSPDGTFTKGNQDSGTLGGSGAWREAFGCVPNLVKSFATAFQPPSSQVEAGCSTHTNASGVARGHKCSSHDPACGVGMYTCGGMVVEGSGRGKDIVHPAHKRHFHPWCGCLIDIASCEICPRSGGACRTSTRQVREDNNKARTQAVTRVDVTGEHIPGMPCRRSAQINQCLRNRQQTPKMASVMRAMVRGARSKLSAVFLDPQACRIPPRCLWHTERIPVH